MCATAALGDGVIAAVPVGLEPGGVAVKPDGSKVYVANKNASVSVIDAATNTVTTTIPAGRDPTGVAVSPDGSKVYVANLGSNAVSVIDTATNTVTALIPVGISPSLVSIQPAPRFAGVPGSANCHGTSVSALATKFGDLDAADRSLGVLQRAGTAGCHSGVLRGIAVRGSARGNSPNATSVADKLPALFRASPARVDRGGLGLSGVG